MRCVLVVAVLVFLDAVATVAQTLDVPPVFIENAGQWNSAVRFRFDRPGMRVWFTDVGPVFDLSDGAGHHHVVRRRDVVAADCRPHGMDADAARATFIRENSNGISAETWESIEYPALVPGVDARYRSVDGTLEYDLMLAPGTDPSSIAFGYDGADSLRIDADGALCVYTSAGIVRERPPIAWQEVGGRRRCVDAAFRLHDGVVEFELGEFDRSRPLLIDPTIVYGSYLGGTAADEARGVAADRDGSIVVTGVTSSEDFPVTTGAYDTQLDQQVVAADLFVARLDPMGRRLLFATYIGGSDRDEPSAVAVRSDGGVIVVGTTWSRDFPLVSPIDTTRVAAEGFVLSLAKDGSRLNWSTFLGGNGDDHVEDVTLSVGGDPVVVGSTSSGDFPTTTGAMSTASNGSLDGFVTRLRPDGSGIRFSTYLGGSGDDEAIAVAIEPGGAVYVAGSTFSADFPVTSAATYAGGGDVFLTVMQFDLSRMLYSTLFGGSAPERPYDLAIDSVAPPAYPNAYVAGRTASIDFPAMTTSSSWFVLKAPLPLPLGTGSGAYVRGIGPTDRGRATTVQVDGAGRAYVAGVTETPASFPVTSDGIRSPTLGGFDVGFALLSADGLSILNASVIGGGGNDVPWRGGILDRFGRLMIAGVTDSPDLPLSRGAYDSTLNRTGGPGPTDAFLLRYGFLTAPVIYAPPTLDLATAGCQTSVVDTFWVYNTGDANLMIEANSIAREGVGFTLLEPTTGLPITVRPGDSIRYIMRFSTSGVVTVDDTLLVFTNDSSASPYRMQLRGIRTAPIVAAAPSPVVFPSTLVCGFVRDTVVTVTNLGSGDATIVGAQVGDPAGPFAVTPLDPTTHFPVLLTSARELKLRVRFTPATAGLHRDTLLIAIGECPVPVRVPLEGRGDSAALTAAVAAVTFPPLAWCDDRPEDTMLVVRNKGDVDVTISDVLSDDAAFEAELPPGTLAPGDSVRIPIRFLPSAASGAIDATLHIEAEPCGMAITVALHGERLPKDSLVAIPDSLDFGMLGGCRGEAIADTLELRMHNPSSKAIDLLDAAIDAPFSVVSEGIPTTLPPGGDVDLRIVFMPMEEGDDTAELLIVTSGSCPDTLRVPVLGRRRDLRLVPRADTIDLGEMGECETVRDTEVVVSNPSPSPIEVDTVVSSGGVELRSPVTPFTIGAGESRTFLLRFVPRQAGAASGRLAMPMPCGDTVAIVVMARKLGAVPDPDRRRVVIPPVLSCSAEVIDSVVLRNTGDGAALVIRDAISGGTIEPVDPIVGASIAAGDSLTIRVRFAPGPAHVDEFLRLVLGPCGDTVAVEFIASTLPANLTSSGGSFGTVNVGSSADTELVFVNDLPTAVVVDSLPDVAEPFSVRGTLPSLPALLAPGDTLRVSMRFSPTTPGLYEPTARLFVSGPCDFQQLVQLEATATGSTATTTLCLDVDGRGDGRPGDTATVRVVTADEPAVLPAGSVTTLVISYDPIALYVIDAGPSPDVVIVDAGRSNGRLVLRVNRPLLPGSPPPSIRFLMLAGGEGATPVAIDSIASNQAQAALSACGDPALLVVFPGCISGITFGSFPSRLDAARPDPAGEVVTIDYQQLEDAHALLRIFDVSGREVMRPLDADLRGDATCCGWT